MICFKKKPKPISSQEKMEKQYAAQEVPTYLAYATGYRAWSIRLSEDGGADIVSRERAWPKYAPFVAEYLSPRDLSFYTGETPYPGPKAGIHAYKTLNSDGLLRSAIFGSVALWGRVEEHTNGYRAEFAYPLALGCPPCSYRNWGVSPNKSSCKNQSIFFIRTNHGLTICEPCLAKWAGGLAATSIKDLTYQTICILDVVYPEIQIDKRWVHNIADVLARLSKEYGVPITIIEELQHANRRMGKNDRTDTDQIAYTGETRERSLPGNTGHAAD